MHHERKRANQSSFMTLNVCKPIMKGSELGNLFLKQKSEVLGRVYTRHKNNCVKLWKS